jgi:hypothetical protein
MVTLRLPETGIANVSNRQGDIMEYEQKELE